MTYFLVNSSSTSSSLSIRKEKIRKARNIGELLKIVKTIGGECEALSRVIDSNLKTTKNFEISNLNVKVSKVLKSTSAGEEDEGIRVTHIAGKVRSPSQIKIKMNTPSGKKGMFPTEIGNFKHPTSLEVEKTLKPVQELQANIAHLESITSLLTQNFSGLKSRTAAVKQVKALTKEANSLVDKSLNSLNKIAEKSCPAELDKIYVYLEKYVASTLPKQTYSKMYESSYLSKGTTDKDSVYSKYLELEDLTNASGFKFPEFFFMLTGVVKGSRLEVYLNTMPDFPVPGSYPLGTRISSYGELEAKVRTLLDSMKILHEIGRRPIPEFSSKKNPLTKLKFVQSTVIKKDILKVVLKKKLSKADEEKLDSAVLEIMHKALGIRAPLNMVKKASSVGKLPSLEYSFYTNGETSKPGISTTKFEAAADILGLDEAGRQQFKRLLSSIE